MFPGLQLKCGSSFKLNKKPNFSLQPAQTTSIEGDLSLLSQIISCAHKSSSALTPKLDYKILESKVISYTAFHLPLYSLEFSFNKYYDYFIMILKEYFLRKYIIIEFRVTDF